MNRLPLLPVLTAKALFDHCKLDSNLLELRVTAGFDAPIFDVLIRDPIYQFAELVQLAPASEAHHHAGPGGLLKHTLDVVALALKKRKGHTLPLGGSISEINQQRHLWTYAVFVGCLLHDIGKLSANTRLVPISQDDEELAWTPQQGPLTQLQDPFGKPRKLKGYRIEFRKTPYRLHEHFALMHWELIPRKGRAWLIEASHIMAELTAWLWGDKYECGSIGQIIEHADRESTARNLQIPADHRFSNVIPAIDRYLKFIRDWIRDGSIRINTNGGMGWVDANNCIYLVCRSLAEKIIQESDALGLKNLPQDPVRVYDILQEHGYALPTPDGRAIWTIGVRNNEYAHKFTCLKFELHRLIPPSRSINPFAGEIFVMEAGDEFQTPATVQKEETPATTAQIPDNPPSPPNDAENTSSDSGFTDAIAQDAAAEIPQQEPANAECSNIENTAATNQDADQIKEHAPAPPGTGTETQDAAAMISKSVHVYSNLDFEAQDTAQKFLAWLQRGLLEKTIVINNPAAEVHIVEEGVFLLAPAIFKTFLRLHNISEEKHKNLSRRFANLRKNIRENDLNIHSYWVSSTNRATKINGWLLPFNVIYENDYPIPKPNKFIKKHLGSAQESLADPKHGGANHSY